MRSFVTTSIVLSVVVLVTSGAGAAESERRIRAGMIGLDTSHVNDFTNIINDPRQTGELANLEVVAGYPGGTDLPLSRDRVRQFTDNLRRKGIEIVDTIPDLLERVDVVMLESVDGRIHLQEAAEVIESGKPLFIDKPVAGSLADAVAIFELAKRHNVPCFSCSSLRYAEGFRKLVADHQIGELRGCATWGPVTYQEGIPDMFFYGIHGIEALFTVMGTGCATVTRATGHDVDQLTGVWSDGRIGTYRGFRHGPTNYGATAFGSREVVTVGATSGSERLCEEIARFFQTHQPPVTAEETIEIFAFMEAADESRRRGGIPIELDSVLKQARKEADEKLQQINVRRSAR